ncbi:membrane protein [Pseudoalteromonas luteoviolacea]|uniref:Membrane protein n=1 Tax=Pseudoalteromonas luteoviolacea NCIMB 1942 TaxID=1365253 RepID=A0A162AE62_9GAMM|nr:OmpA family protein [Pseudoalteromonas luteoviolacea]KZN46108.1 membrane protein [Pseudoalteromonas luteoviolacea NCIMB 1942]KZW98684.1 membrane protein [Pseudoalteromonas luteoviolacea]
MKCNINILVATIVLSVVWPAQSAMRQYSASVDSSKWMVDRTTRLSCTLSHNVPYYGEAIFSSTASKNKDLTFSLDMVIRPESYDFAGLESVPPSWRAGTPARSMGKMSLLKKFDGELGNPVAWEMLTELEKGYQPTFYYEDWNNKHDQISVSLSSVNFKKSYWEFLQCRDNLLPYSFEDIAFVVMNYRQNSSELTQSSRKRLDMIGEYLNNDPDIDSIYISAYSDSYGAKNVNLNLSKKRAMAIKDYMASKGVPANKIIADGFGEKRHVAINTTPIGREANRRVIIQISKP